MRGRRVYVDLAAKADAPGQVLVGACTKVNLWKVQMKLKPRLHDKLIVLAHATQQLQTNFPGLIQFSL